MTADLTQDRRTSTNPIQTEQASEELPPLDSRATLEAILLRFQEEGAMRKDLENRPHVGNHYQPYSQSPKQSARHGEANL
jgi:hypothetical protein